VSDPIPFEDLFTTYVTVARQRLESALKAADLLTPEAWRDLERSLLTRLSSLSEQALAEDFDRFRGGPPDALSVRLAEAGVRRSTGRYRDFISRHMEDCLQTWAREWPVLARLTAMAVEQWVGNGLEMLTRAGEDLAVDRVLGIEAGLSDLHDGGRSVHILTLSGGRKVVYKPRGLGLEAVFSLLLAWCNERGLSLELHTPPALDCGTHGWAEFVAPEPCADAEAARRFHRRAGMLLGLLHAFRSRDFHYENLVARGEHPVLVDLEAWMPLRLHRWLPAKEPGEGWATATALLEESVLSTGMLPRWQQGLRAGELINVGGLGGGRPAVRLQPVWQNVNTDQMLRGWCEVETGAHANVPTLDGVPLQPAAYVTEVTEGFTEMYRLLLRHRAELSSPAGPLRGLPVNRTRLIFRPTAAYRRLRDRSLRPACLRDGAVRSLELDCLARVYLDAGSSRPPTWPLLAAERAALERGDIPRFLAPVDGTEIEVEGGGRVAGVLAASSLAVFEARLEDLGEEDLERQIGFIRASLAMGSEAACPPPVPRKLDRDRLLRAAAAIAGRIRERAISGRDGSVAWIGPRRLADGESYELMVLGSDLYGGTAGIALFLAAFYRVTGDASARDLALRAVAPLRGGIVRKDPGLGGLSGLGSLLYSLVWIGELLDEPELTRVAAGLSAGITPERISQDTHQDVALGCAGALLALLALDKVAPGPNNAGFTPLALAESCAQALLSPRTGSTAGFAHGTAGVRYALLRLFARTGRPELLAAARVGLPPPKGPEGPARATWCNGVPGIALSRLGTLDVLDGPEVREEIRTALGATRSFALTPIDHLCCGNMGRVEALLSAHLVLGCEDLRTKAWEIAGEVLDRAGEEGLFGCLPVRGGDLSDPSFFLGDSGVGFTLLRLLAPETLPCPLLLEAPGSGTIPRPNGRR